MVWYQFEAMNVHFATLLAIPLALPWPFPGPSLVLPWPFLGPSLALPWPFFSPSLALPWPVRTQGHGASVFLRVRPRRRETVERLLHSDGLSVVLGGTGERLLESCGPEENANSLLYFGVFHHFSIIFMIFITVNEFWVCLFFFDCFLIVVWLFFDCFLIVSWLFLDCFLIVSWLCGWLSIVLLIVLIVFWLFLIVLTPFGCFLIVC